MKEEICENCKYGELSWISTDGQDIRESLYPPMIVCWQKDTDDFLKYPYHTCEHFTLKEKNGN